MPFCPNPSCKHRQRLGKPAEFLKGTTTCSDCGSTLSDTLPLFINTVSVPEKIVGWTCPACFSINHNDISLCSSCGYDSNKPFKGFIDLLAAKNMPGFVKPPDNLSVDKIDFPKVNYWTITDIALGISILLILKLIFLVFQNADALRYRPWLSTHISFSLELVMLCSLFAYSIHICKKREYWPLVHSLQLAKLARELLKGLLYIFLMGLFIGPVIILVKYLFKINQTTAPLVQFTQNDPNSYLTIPLLIIAISIGPIVEEFFFRGFLFNALKSRLPIWIAVFVQAILFSAMHNDDMMHSFGVFLFGIALAIIYEHKKDLLSPIVVHSLGNALLVIPLLILAIQNHHVSSTTWDEAQMNPSWMSQPNEGLLQQKDGQSQVQFAIDTWGSKGKRQWKKEVMAFNAVLNYFPNDRAACAKAMNGIVEIYAEHLRDYRRAIVKADIILSQYSDQRDQLSHALLEKAYAFMMLKDFDNARKSYQTVLNEFHDYQKNVDVAIAGIKWIDYLEK